MQKWLNRARAIVPKRVIRRGSSDLPTLEDLEEYGGYLRGLLAEDPSLRWFKLREAIKAKGFLVSEKTMRIWLDRYHGAMERERERALVCEERRTNRSILTSLGNRRKPLQVLMAMDNDDVNILRREGDDPFGDLHVLHDGHTGTIFSAVFSQDMRWVLTASLDKTAQM